MKITDFLPLVFLSVPLIDVYMRSAVYEFTIMMDGGVKCKEHETVYTRTLYISIHLLLMQQTQLWGSGTLCWRPNESWVIYHVESQSSSPACAPCTAPSWFFICFIFYSFLFGCVFFHLYTWFLSFFHYFLHSCLSCFLVFAFYSFPPSPPFYYRRPFCLFRPFSIWIIVCSRETSSVTSTVPSTVQISQHAFHIKPWKFESAVILLTMNSRLIGKLVSELKYYIISCCHVCLSEGKVDVHVFYGMVALTVCTVWLLQCTAEATFK